MITLRINQLDVDQYLELRREVGWKKLSNRQAKIALENSLCIVTAYSDNKLVGMGRVVGDGAVICYVQDLAILPEVQGQGIGGKILDKLTEYVKSITGESEEMMLDLMCAKGRENFYIRHGFIARPTQKLGPGMIQYIKKGDTL